MSNPTNETTALAVQDYGLRTVVSVDQSLRRIKDLQEFVGKVMVRDEDYGVIPGTGKKPSLLKPGAEKLCEMYGLAPTFEIIDSIKEWEDGFFYYEVKCTLVSKQHATIAAEGLGSCNSREKRYRNQDVYTIANTILKMAKKRAHVDATLSATRSSGVFTQDVEDIADNGEEPAGPRGRPEPVPPKPEPPMDRARAEQVYREQTEKADTLGIPVESFDRRWSDLEVRTKYRALRDGIRAKEDALAEATSAAP